MSRNASNVYSPIKEILQKKIQSLIIKASDCLWERLTSVKEMFYYIMNILGDGRNVIFSDARKRHDGLHAHSSLFY